MSSFVVTHWHADHYRGFTGLPNSWLSGILPPAATLYYPVMPEAAGSRLAYNLRAFAMLAREDPVDLPMVRRELGRLYRLALQPLGRGDSVALSGWQFTVLWPPKRWAGSLASKINKAIVAAEALAKDDDNFRGILDELRSKEGLAPFVVSPHEAQDESGGPQPEEEWLSYSEGPPDQTDGSSGDDHFDLVARQQSDGSHLDERRSDLGKTLSDVANALSLIPYQPQLGLLLPGDATAGSLSSALRGIPTDELRVLLAPHHGTKDLGKELTKRNVDVCISQDGPVRPTRAWDKYAREHAWHTYCLSTDLHGRLTAVW